MTPSRNMTAMCARRAWWLVSSLMIGAAFHWGCGRSTDSLGDGDGDGDGNGDGGGDGDGDSDGDGDDDGPDPCDPDPCVHGECVAGGGRAVCDCEWGWIGELCDEPDVCVAGDRITVRPVIYVPADGELSDPNAALELFAAHSALARALYRSLLVTDTLCFAAPDIYLSDLSTAEILEASPDSAHLMTAELLAWGGTDRNLSRDLFVAAFVRSGSVPCEEGPHACLGGGRTFNGYPGSGGGFIQIEAESLLHDTVMDGIR